MELDTEEEDVVEMLEPGYEIRIRSGDDEYSGYLVNKAKTVVGDDEQYILSLMPWDIKGISYNQEFLSEYGVSSPENLTSKNVRDVSESLDDLSITDSPVLAKSRYSSKEGRGHIDEIKVIDGDGRAKVRSS